ncbi:hypothetical protein As57867_007794, partial [Aphanomyces stellatus]
MRELQADGVKNNTAESDGIHADMKTPQSYEEDLRATASSFFERFMTGQIQPDDDQEAFYSVQTCQVVGSAETFAAAFLNSTDLSLERIWQTKSHLFDGIQILSLDVVKGETDGEVKVHIVEDGKLGRDVWTLKDVFNAHFVDQVAASHATRVRLTWEI